MKYNSTEENKRRKLAIHLLESTFIVFGILVVLFLLQNNNTTIIENEDAVETTQFLTCDGDISYPFFSYDNASGKTLKVNAIFYNDILNEISITYKLYYGSNAQAKESEARNHADLGISFGKDSLGVDALGVNFSILDNVMQMSLNTKANNIGIVESKYFLIEDANRIYNVSDLIEIYANKGLNCLSKQ